MITTCELRHHTLMCTETGYTCINCGTVFPLGFFSHGDGIEPEGRCPKGGCGA